MAGHGIVGTVGADRRTGRVRGFPVGPILPLEHPGQRVPQAVAVWEGLGEHGPAPKIFPHPYEDGSPPCLGDTQPLRIQDPALHPVTAGFELRQDFEEVALGDTLHQPAHVLGHKDPGAQAIQEADVFKEEIVHPLDRVRVFLGLAPVLLPLAGRRERGTRGRAFQDIEFAHLQPHRFKDRLRLHLPDVFGAEQGAGVVGSVGFRRCRDELVGPEHPIARHPEAEAGSAAPAESRDHTQPVVGNAFHLGHRWHVVGWFLRAHGWPCTSGGWFRRQATPRGRDGRNCAGSRFP